MIRIAGIDLNDKWKVTYALTNIKGIGWTRAKKIVADVKVDIGKRVADLSQDDVVKLTAEVEKFPVEGDLIRTVRGNIARLRQIGTYRGYRHAHSLPVRGQRTKSNARTKRGKRKTIGAFKKEMLAKQPTTTTAQK
ncbi:hypothetical protein A2188_02655 [Candidatus Woesebacteria bacterium RIFOXYA1_FULL_43_9]|uniref:Small ribosomal subunit protein uS13 n=1 Tax=Candidatus Woesebacteria bacterium RIFOXYA1_FULL_43_9 TaxID=1802534 RepID=A0A1F8CN18_9BACT|nr:MAG: hypothetical protein A2188_02655 [Candidatus Woesebacteria bacterium RIFOXYA1_FULL_43_9]